MKKERELSELAQKILEVEQGYRRFGRTRDEAIRKHIGVTPTRYYLYLGTLLDSEDFYYADPPLVDRLKRLRDERLRERHGVDGSESL